MGNRLSKIYTRTGDDGTTGMANGGRVDKDDLLVHAIGEVDELNSQLAVLCCQVTDEFLQPIRRIQNELFDVGAELAMGKAIITQDYVDWLEQSLDVMNQSLPPLQEFILPGGGLAASHCHLARAMCRRAERTLVTLHKLKSINVKLLVYFNRLSDYLFVLARTVSKQAGAEELYWQSSRIKPRT